MCTQRQVLVFPYMYSVWIVIQSVLVVQGVYARFEVVPPPEPPKMQSVIVDEAARREGETFATPGHAREKEKMEDANVAFTSQP